jgi:exopolysaccharide biosynthesis polyprenyl glycosylphosphotransferase
LRIVVAGAGEHGRALAHYLRTRSESTEVVGFIDDRLQRIDRSTLTAPFLGGTAQFASLPRAVDGVVIGIPNDATNRIQALANRLRNGQINIYLAPAVPLLNLGHLHLARGQENLRDMVLLGMQRLPVVGRVSKRLFDIVFSATVLLLFLPFGIAIAALIKLESPGPVFFRQGRYGQGCRLFDMYKFRSMRFDPAASHGEIRLTERGDARVTRLGDFLRRTSLDEFPQFMNVLLGHMSVVGPRPHPPGVKAGDRIYEDVVADFLERYKVRPGITGWAQVNGLRGNTFTEDHLMRRFASDVEYIRNWSFELDLCIMLKTVWGGFRGKNAF